MADEQVSNAIYAAAVSISTALARGITAVTFANAPTPPVQGMIQAFTDSTTNTWGATITGGSTNHVLGYYNGSNWTVCAK